MDVSDDELYAGYLPLTAIRNSAYFTGVSLSHDLLAYCALIEGTYTPFHTGNRKTA